MTQQESLLIWGPWQKEIRETFGAARPILQKLPAAVDRLFILYLLREQTWIAMNYPDSEQRKIEHAWVNLCRSIETFLKVTFGKPAKELSNDLQNRRAAAEAAGTSVAWWPSVGDIKPSPELIGALKTYSAVLGLPEYNEAIERQSGGRPTAFWSDAVAFAMAEYLREQTKSPKWSAISNLLKCAPQIPQISMDPAKIRQRLVRWKREEKAQQRFKPTLRESAYEVKRLFDKWDRESPCPSLLVASEFRNPAGDTSISQINSKLIDDIANKYPT